MKTRLGLLSLLLAHVLGCDVSGLRSRPPERSSGPEMEAPRGPATGESLPEQGTEPIVTPSEREGCAWTERPCSAGCCAWKVERVRVGGASRGSLSIFAAPDAAYVAFPQFAEGVRVLRFAEGGHSSELAAAFPNSIASTSMHRSADARTPMLAVTITPSDGWFVKWRTQDVWTGELPAQPTLRPGVAEVRTGPDGSAVLLVVSDIYELVLLRREKTRWESQGWTGLYGAHPSFDIDRQGKVHITHFSQHDQTLLYSIFEGDGVSQEKILSTASHMAAPLRVDAAGNPHLFFTRMNGEIIYRHLGAGGWTEEVLPVRGYDLGHASLELDANGQPNLVFNGHDAVMLAVRREGSWDIRPVGPRRTSFCPPVLALDTDGHPHVAWFDSVESEVYYAH